jgi:hypothetical protein
MTQHSKKSRRLYGTDPLKQLRSVSNKVPSRYVDKETVRFSEPREVQAIENVYEFFTKQRPLAWQYYYRQVTVPLYRTGTSEEDNDPISTVIDTLDVNEALVINHLSAQILYRPEPPTGFSVRPGNYIAVERVEQPTVEDFFIVVALRSRFQFNLLSTTTRLYEANVSANVPDPTFSLSVANRDGYSTLNTNVLENNDSGTSLYVLETGDLSVSFSAIDSYVSTPANALAFGLLPYDAIEDNGGLVASPKIVFDIRGHKITKNDAELLKQLIQNN